MELQVQEREIFGKKVNALRRDGLIPAELYGHNFPNFHLAVKTADFLNVFKQAGESAIVKLRIESEKSDDINVLIHEVLRDPMTGRVLHVDFYRVRMDEKLTASIPIRFSGEALAVKEKDGVLIKAMQEVEVEALPGDLPQHIDVSLDKLNEIGASIYVKDLDLGRNVKILADPGSVIVTIAEKQAEEVAPQGPTSVEEVKVEAEEKRETKEKEKEKTL
ncbi:50S ribosomal protein L25 [Candidatus Wolfebacteria bacterium]|nr:50S ribosomal protein L25 [Candidatus Wolfebacteria bacterium]